MYRTRIAALVAGLVLAWPTPAGWFGPDEKDVGVTVVSVQGVRLAASQGQTCSYTVCFAIQNNAKKPLQWVSFTANGVLKGRSTEYTFGGPFQSVTTDRIIAPGQRSEECYESHFGDEWACDISQVRVVIESARF